jgi:dTDP-4-dehydrorhamnose 3,5-epimerase
MVSLSIESCTIEGLLRIRRENFEDARGLFSRLYSFRELAERGFREAPGQINYSRTRGAGSVRGMHFQRPPHAEAKMVTCLQGEVFDVAVDLRAGSKTFLHWHGENLSGHRLNSLVIPEGVAHGFQVLSDEAHLLYLHSKSYEPQSEGRVHPLDPVLKIEWPREVCNLSPQDMKIPFLEAHFAGLQMDGTSSFPNSSKRP